MPILDDAFPHLPTTGRVGLLELANVSNPEAGRAATSITAHAVRQHGGRFEWAGHVDQLLFGDVGDVPDEVFISTYPSKKQALDVLAARREWGFDDLVTKNDVLAYRAPGFIGRTLPGVVFGGLRLTGRKTPRADLADPDLLDVGFPDSGDPSLRPSREALAKYATSGIEGKVIMLNFLRFARDGQGSKAAGRAAYGRYGRASAPMIAGLGGRIRALGRAPRRDGESEAAAFDEFVCVQYPSRADFIGMVTAPRYATGHDDRDAGLDRSALLVCTSHADFF